MPADGVYVVDNGSAASEISWHGKCWKNVTFDGEEPRLNQYFRLFRRYYGETVMVYWLDRVETMVKFDSIDEL